MIQPLTRLGLRDGLTHELDARGLADHAPARVLAQYRNSWLVGEPGDEAPPRLVSARGRLRADGPPVAGDWVALDRDGTIAAVLERRGTVTRRAAGTPAPQTLAANVELALVVEPLPEPNARRAERIVALAAAGGVHAVLVLTKADLDPDAAGTATQYARDVGLAGAISTSARAGAGLDALRTLIAPGQTAVLLGPSGAGKSTLANALLGEQRQATGEIRAHDGRGRHTTVVRELLPLPGGGLLLDTPGIREAGLWDSEGESDAFSDIEALAANCRFADCRHEQDPGCAVRDAIAPERLEAWRKLAREQAWVDDRRAATRDRDQRGRSYRNVVRDARSAKGDQDEE